MKSFFASFKGMLAKIDKFVPSHSASRVHAVANYEPGRHARCCNSDVELFRMVNQINR